MRESIYANPVLIFYLGVSYARPADAGAGSRKPNPVPGFGPPASIPRVGRCRARH